MLFNLLILYNFGGFVCGLSLGVYAIFSLLHKRFSWWIHSLGIGWFLFILGSISSMHAQLTLPKNHSGLDYWAGLLEVGPFFWWIALVMCLMVRRKEGIVSSQMKSPDKPSEGVWPPPPTK